MLPDDKISLLVSGKEVDNFNSYHLISDLFESSDGFGFDFGDLNESLTINKGDFCEVRINNKLELTGVITSPVRSYDKGSSLRAVKGKDRMGLLVDYHLQQFGTIENTSPSDFARVLLNADNSTVKLSTIEKQTILVTGVTAQQIFDNSPSEDPFAFFIARLFIDVPFLNRSKIVFGVGDKDTIAARATLPDNDSDDDSRQVQPGDTLFDVLKRSALGQGLLFFALSDGTFVFGEPVTSGTKDFDLIRRISDPSQNNIKTGIFEDDLEPRYSSTTVIGDARVSAKVFDDKFPQNYGRVVDFTSSPSTTVTPASIDTKPFVVEEEDIDTAEKCRKRAKLLVAQQRFKGLNLKYTVIGHSQGGKNWQTNKIVHVQDEKFKIDADFLINRREFNMSLEQGTTTTLGLSELGALPA